MKQILDRLAAGLKAFIWAAGGLFATMSVAGEGFSWDADQVGQVWPPSAEDRVVRISGIYPHLAVFNTYGECGIGAVVPWADKLWLITYPPHCPYGGEDKLYTVDKALKLVIRPESVGGTHANRLVHRESNQLVIGPHLIDAEGRVRTFDLKQLVGRMTATARHLSDPANMVYMSDMEGAVYEADVHTLAVKRLFEKPVPGWHGKGSYTSQGRLVLANNGESAVDNKRRNYLAGSDPVNPWEMGVLAEWDGTTCRIVERCQFTEVTGPGGIFGAPDEKSPLWAMGWDKRSVMLKLLDKGVWHTFRLPKASYTQESKNGCYTEWPRIREVTEGHTLASMQCLFYDFPKTFSTANCGGLRPISTYTRMPVDFCAWQGRIVMARDDASVMENELAGQSHSSLWFGSWSDLENLGTPAGWGGPWLDDTVAAGAVSDPFLVNGFREGVLHLKQDSDSALNIQIEADRDGNGLWVAMAAVTVPARGYAYRILNAELKAQWVRLRAQQSATGLCAVFRVGNPPRAADKGRFQALADIAYQGPIVNGVVKPALKDARRLQFASDLCEGTQVVERAAWSMDGKLELSRMESPADESALRGKYGLGGKPVFSVDEASVIVYDGKRRFRLPKSAAEYDRPFACGWPRALREVVTERSLLNAHGTIYEVPSGDAGGFRRMRPVCTHNKRISDFASWRGLLVMSGVRADAKADGHCYRSADGKAALWMGEVDDLWHMGAPAGAGGPWKNTSVATGQASDPYLMAGYRTKSLALSHQGSRPAVIVVEVDIDGNDHWCEYAKLNVPPNETVTHRFPDGYSAHWMRLRCDCDTVATALLTYMP